MNTTAPQVQESKVAGITSFRLLVTDESGAVVEGVRATSISMPRAESVETDADGGAIIPTCGEFEIGFLNYRGRYRPVDAMSNVFAVTLTNEQLSAVTIDEVWQIEGGRLYIANESGKITEESGLGKLSAKRERAIFGKAPPK